MKRYLMQLRSHTYPDNRPIFEIYEAKDLIDLKNKLDKRYLKDFIDILAVEDFVEKGICDRCNEEGVIGSRHLCHDIVLNNIKQKICANNGHDWVFVQVHPDSPTEKKCSICDILARDVPSVGGWL